MTLQDIEKTIKNSFEDFRLSKSEKYELGILLEKVKHDSANLNFIRNKAFELVADHYRYKKDLYNESLKWLEGIIKSIDSVQNISAAVDNQAYFSPGNEPINKIMALIERAKQSINVCVFTISDDNITRALLEAHKRKIAVKIITDNDKAEDRGSDIYRLSEKGIPVKIDRTDNHMHHKFAVIDNRYLISGSFNWTRSATKYNQENIIVSNDMKLINQFDEHFISLWEKYDLL